jgi:SAM-dependent methyltransferase
MSALIGRLRRKIRRRLAPGQLDLLGDRDLEWGFVAGHISDRGGTALDFGCGNAPLGLVAALKGYRVLAVDRNPVIWTAEAENLKFHQADILVDGLDGQLFDVILNCSTVEHVGLAGRFGSTPDLDGDVKAMRCLRDLLGPNGQMLLTIPVGQDMVCQPYHRIYGSVRLPQLLGGYQTRHEQYWGKRPGRNVWVQMEKAEAQAVVGGPASYALGLLVLERA